ncbi:hypothetical protein SAY87_011366 [Trapa incisa]|uniref:Inhibitor I9 domain-containing protein n=1 Tax=Trapa incisa TaxID=236973 RepID=A0AAN7GMW6_9MYRT|nr:hypothetical protein SAY87_011366 [Trapa incisa]
MAEAPSEATIRVIYTEKPPVNDVESHHIRTLAAVLGSEEAARRSLIYVYKNAASGFSAVLTPQQVEELSKQPGVYQSVPQRKGARAESFSLVFPPLVLVISIFFSSIAIAMARAPSEATVHIIYTEKPPVDDVESHHIRTLAAVLGSEEAARQSLIYVYKNAATGFSAKLTPQQVEELSTLTSPTPSLKVNPLALLWYLWSA